MNNQLPKRILAVLFSLLICYSAMQSNKLWAADDAVRKPITAHIVPITESPYGQSYGEWAADFTRWVYSIPLAKNPYFSNIHECTTPQTGKVWFVATKSKGAHCEIPRDKAIFVTFGGYVDTYPCPVTPGVPPFEPAPGQALEDFLTLDARAIVDANTQNRAIPHGLRIDGNDFLAAHDALNQRVTTKLMTLTGDSSLKAIDGCVTGTAQKAVSDGYWAMIEGLTPGRHKLQFISPKGKITNTLYLEVSGE